MKTNAEMLQQIIEYAVERGWGNAWQREFFKHWSFDGDNPFYFISHHKGLQNFRYESVLFDKSFAKAVFGEEGVKDWPCDYKVFDEEKCKVPAWQYHLQQAVISPDPILYYYNFVTERRER